VKPLNGWRGQALRLLALVLLCALALQLVFLARIALMRVVDPQSTAFQRSEAWRLLQADQPWRWQQQWVDRAALSAHLQRAAVASEDAGFFQHHGVEWAAIEQALERNERAAARAERLARQRRQPGVPRVVGGSTITQQLAKNLFLSGERTVLRKAQELVLALMLEALLPKQRLLEIYLNNVEWGEGVFGAQAAARRYFRVDAGRLSPAQAARLAVMLPAPKRFEKNPASAYVLNRAATIQARMQGVALPP
jgi:monofunctional biosynthetic peptidoglycan transglycosylase